MKSNMRSILCLSLAAAASTATPAAAQTGQQTPENAKKFIELTMLGAEISPRDYYPYQIYIRLVPTGQGPYSNGLCYISFRVTKTVKLRGEPEQSYTDGTIGLDFQSMSDVRSEGSVVFMAQPAPMDYSLKTGLSAVHLPSEDLATRLAFAMTFLKAHCNPADNLGF
ncbi:hypothetical protein [Sphingopyxis sp. KK2]|uniref:hypothetical protein n=1 Tax=Sphingopyxis sp. KK2 TaxID=1855727 RepID=UPI00097E6838|nr:hypothetical protein [Sphingopyxis sp. KK2]